MSKSLLASLLVLLSLSGCGGSEKKTEFVFIRHNGMAARAAKNIKIPAVVEKPNGETVMDEVDIGGFYLISPDLKDKPIEQVVKELKAQEVKKP